MQWHQVMMDVALLIKDIHFQVHSGSGSKTGIECKYLHGVATWTWDGEVYDKQRLNDTKHQLEFINKLFLFVLHSIADECG